MSLDDSILKCPIPAPVQDQISRNLWGAPASIASRSYFNYYTDQCRTACQICSGQLTSLQHQDVVDIARDLNKGLTRFEIRERREYMFTKEDETASDEAIESSIDLSVRLALMLDVGEMRNAFSGRKQLLWTSGSLADLVRDTFQPQTALSHDGIKLGGVFTARNLERIAGLNVELTTNLADHLRFRDDRTITIFHHASFLKCQQNNPIFPPGFIAETLRTLALLFPQNDRQTRHWYNKKEDAEELDPELFRCGRAHRQIQRYKYWRDQLVILKEEFDESPSTWMRLWNDRREGIQWFTLWLAIGFTVFFGLVQSIEGGIQVYKTWHPTQA